MASGDLRRRRTTGSLTARSISAGVRARFTTARLRLLAVPLILTEVGRILYGVGTLTIAAIRRRIRSGGTLTGTGTLTAGPVRNRHNSAAITGVGTLTAGPVRAKQRGLVMLGVGTLIAGAMKILASKIFAPQILGIGLLVQAVQRIRHRAAEILGVGTLTAGGVRLRHRTEGLLGVGLLAGVVTRCRQRAAAILGVGTLTTSLHRIRHRAAEILGVGSITTAATRTRHRSGGVILGVGTLTAAPVRLKPRGLILNGVGLLTAGAQKISGASFTAGTAVFDGTNDSMRLTSSGPTGLADSKVGWISFWVNMAGSTDGVEYRIINIGNSSASTRLFVRRTTGNKLQVQGRSSAPATLLEFLTTTSVVAASGWVHFYCTWDMAGTSAALKVYINGSADTPTNVTYTDGTIELVGTNFRYCFGSNAGTTPGALLLGALSELAFNDAYADSPSTFISGGNPVDPGATGTGAVFYFHGSGDDFDVNSGTGGNPTITGSLGTTTPPP